MSVSKFISHTFCHQMCVCSFITLCWVLNKLIVLKVLNGKTLVTKEKTLVTKGKTLVTKGKTLVTKGKTLVTKGKTVVTGKERPWS